MPVTSPTDGVGAKERAGVLTGSVSLVLSGVCVAALLVVTVVMLLARTRRAPDREIGRPDRAAGTAPATVSPAPHDDPTTTTGER